MKFLSSILIPLLLIGCTYKKEVDIHETDYPKEIGKIIHQSCVIAGCHNDASYQAAGGLNLTTWDNLFEGSSGGMPVIPYRPKESFMMYFLHQDESITPVISPLMPLNGDPLSLEEVQLIYDWIEEGAPNAKGNIAFDALISEDKIFITNQGCDMITVMDKHSRKIIRMFDVGNEPSIESPHFLKLSPDKSTLYVCFTAGSYFQAFNTTTFEKVGEVNIGFGNWNTFALKNDGSTAFVTEWESNGKVAVVDLNNFELLLTFQGGGLLSYPHGSMIGPNDQYLYLTAQTGNFLYKADVSNPEDTEEFEQISMNDTPPSSSPSLDIHEIIFSNDGSQYFITCQRSNEVRVLQTTNDSLLKVIPTGDYPQELAVAPNHPYVLVTCPEDTTSFPGKRGSVQIINTNTLETVTTIFTGYQPHGISIDNDDPYAYIANRNQTSTGIAPHHTSDCGGRNGYMTVIDLNTLTLLEDQIELISDPYSVIAQ